MAKLKQEKRLVPNQDARTEPQHVKNCEWSYRVCCVLENLTLILRSCAQTLANTSKKRQAEKVATMHGASRICCLLGLLEASSGASWRPLCCSAILGYLGSLLEASWDPLGEPLNK